MYMTLEDYIRDQQKKAREKAQDIKNSAEDAWDETKSRGRQATDDVRDALNG